MWERAAEVWLGGGQVSGGQDRCEKRQEVTSAPFPVGWHRGGALQPSDKEQRKGLPDAFLPKHLWFPGSPHRGRGQAVVPGSWPRLRCSTGGQIRTGKAGKSPRPVVPLWGPDCCAHGREVRGTRSGAAACALAVTHAAPSADLT